MKKRCHDAVKGETEAGPAADAGPAGRQPDCDTPGFSKWETDSSYPDITLLCPLARALRCRVDELLQFAPAMTEAEAAEHLDSVVHLALSGDRTGAEQALTALVQEYPGCAVLQYHAAVGWSALQILFPQADEADRQRWQARALALWEELHSGSDAAMAQYAANQLASHAVLHGELDRAEALLDELPQQIVDPTMTRYQLQLKQGAPDAARATLQKRLFALGAAGGRRAGGAARRTAGKRSASWRRPKRTTRWPARSVCWIQAHC